MNKRRNQRLATITIRLTRQELRRVLREAHAEGRVVSRFVRHAIG
jgi:hypothetical protein